MSAPLNLKSLMASSVSLTEGALGCCPLHSLWYCPGAAMQAAYAYRYLKADPAVFSVLYAVKPYGHLVRWQIGDEKHELRFLELSSQRRNN